MIKCDGKRVELKGSNFDHLISLATITYALKEEIPANLLLSSILCCFADKKGPGSEKRTAEEFEEFVNVACKQAKGTLYPDPEREEVIKLFAKLFGDIFNVGEGED
jgi:hypothetical protein